MRLTGSVSKCEGFDWARGVYSNVTAGVDDADLDDSELQMAGIRSIHLTRKHCFVWMVIRLRLYRSIGGGGVQVLAERMQVCRYMVHSFWEDQRKDRLRSPCHNVSCK